MEVVLVFDKSQNDRRNMDGYWRLTAHSINDATANAELAMIPVLCIKRCETQFAQQISDTQSIEKYNM